MIALTVLAALAAALGLAVRLLLLARSAETAARAALDAERAGRAQLEAAHRGLLGGGPRLRSAPARARCGQGRPDRDATTLLALLPATHHGWRQAEVEQSALEIAAAGRELHKRCATFLDALAKLGRQLGPATNAYNDAVGSLEGRVLPQLRRLEQHGAGSEERLGAPARSTPPRGGSTRRSCAWRSSHRRLARTGRRRERRHGGRRGGGPGGGYQRCGRGVSGRDRTRGHKRRSAAPPPTRRTQGR